MLLAFLSIVSSILSTSSLDSLLLAASLVVVSLPSPPPQTRVSRRRPSHCLLSSWLFFHSSSFKLSAHAVRLIECLAVRGRLLALRATSSVVAITPHSVPNSQPHPPLPLTLQSSCWLLDITPPTIGKSHLLLPPLASLQQHHTKSHQLNTHMARG